MTFEESIRAAVREVIQDELRPLVEDLKRLARPTEDELLRYDQAAKLAKVCAGTIRAWVRQGRLKRYGSGRVPLVRRVELLELRPAEPDTGPGLDPEEAATLMLHGAKAK